MKKIIFIVLTGYIIISFSCNNRKIEKDLPAIHINKKNIQEAGNLDTIIQSVEFVALETNDTSLIKEVSEVINIGDSILVGDFKLGKVLIFSPEGNLISMFKNTGKGPGEYVRIDDMTYDYIRNEILIIDIGLKNILRYDLKGNYISSQKINTKNAGMFMEWFNNSFVFYCHNFVLQDHPNENVIITDQNQQYINSAAIIPKPIENLSFWGNKNMSISDSLLYVQPCFNDTIFSINRKNLIKPALLINTSPEFNIKKSRLWKRGFTNIIEFHEYARKNNYIYQTSDFMALPNNLIFRYYTNKGYSLVVYSKKNNTTTIYDKPTFTLDNFIFNPVGKIKDKVITVIEPSDKIDKLNKYLKRPVDLNSNPVLCFIEIKK
ncbi:6-bladed beta-propeller [Abyssalbus ytuae]|uniref:6-bladed beta-propeller n=1 Tax=Abyssalbus ytuae TaxID=2926907 RepID=A0A9E7CY23_9FLAO|nr:6-bladed beta-propeller [Abyssalbus ytuae]UOB16180.1 6-bladed beta-propeller [Abyssalbus ytuae]